MSRGERDVESVEVLVGVLGVHLDDQRILPRPAGAHRHVLEADALALDGLDELHEGGRAHHGDRLRGVGAESTCGADRDPRVCSGRMLLLDAVGAQADDGGDVPNVPAFLEHEDGDDGLVGGLPGINLIGLFAKTLQLLLVLSGGRLGDLAVVLGVDDEHRSPEFGTDLFEVRAYFIAIPGVVHHDEEHRLLPQRLVVRIALAPLLHPKRKEVRILLREDGALVFVELGAAGGVGQDGMLDDVLVDGLDERVVGNRLDEDRAVVVARRGGHVDLEGEAAVLLEHLVVDVLNGLEPRHARIVDVVRLVVEDGKLVDLADDLAEVGLAVGGLAGGLGPEGVARK